MKYKIPLSLVVAFMLVLTGLFMVVGYSASNANTESVEESAQLQPEEYLGTWRVMSMGDEDMTRPAYDGMFTTYVFEEDGTFKSNVTVYGQTMERAGTYEVRDGALYVSLPEMDESIGSVEYQGVTVTPSGPAVEDVEIRFDGDQLTTETFNGDGRVVSAVRISDEEYEALVEESASYGPQTVEVGETVDTEGYSFTVNSFSYVDEIYPSDMSGYYTYLPDEEGKSYLFADVTYTNNWTEYSSPGQSTAANFSVGENKYSGIVEVDGGAQFLSIYSIEAKDTGRVLIYASVPDAAIDSGAPVLTWTFPKDPSLLNAYYNSSFETIEYVVNG